MYLIREKLFSVGSSYKVDISGLCFFCHDMIVESVNDKNDDGLLNFGSYDVHCVLCLHPASFGTGPYGEI